MGHRLWHIDYIIYSLYDIVYTHVYFIQRLIKRVLQKYPEPSKIPNDLDGNPLI